MSRIIFVPSIGLDVTLIERLANSIDTHFDYAIAWNNGPLGALDAFGERHPNWIVKDSAFGNLGCAGSWNQAAKLFPDEPGILLVNEDTWFLPDQLDMMFSVMKSAPYVDMVHVNSTHSYHCFGWTRASRERFGTFDENFWPAYYEDCDMRVRHGLSGSCSYALALPDSPTVPHGKPRCGGTDYSAMLQGCGLLNRAYWRKKWGSDNREQAEFQTPYRDHRLTYRDVVWYPEHRAQLYPLWEAFINKPGVCLYD